jgi:hypothetical protein
MNPDVRFAELYSILQRLEDDYNIDQYGSSVLLDQIINNRKAAVHQMQLTIIKDQINTEAICLKADIAYVKEVTLKYVQAKFFEKRPTIQHHKGKSSSKGNPVRLITTTSPTKNRFTKPFKKILVSVAKKVTSL